MGRFEIELVLKSGEHLPLFCFLGDSERTTGLLAVALSDSLVPFQGEQGEQDAQLPTFLRQLERLTRLPPVPLCQGVERRAEPLGLECSQANVPRARCLTTQGVPLAPRLEAVRDLTGDVTPNLTG